MALNAAYGCSAVQHPSDGLVGGTAIIEVRLPVHAFMNPLPEAFDSYVDLDQILSGVDIAFRK